MLWLQEKESRLTAEAKVILLSLQTLSVISVFRSATPSCHQLLATRVLGAMGASRGECMIAAPASPEPLCSIRRAP